MNMPPRETLLRQMRLDDQGHQNGQRFVWLENNQVYYNEIDSIDRTIPARNIPTPPLPIPSVQIYAPLSQTSLTIFRYPLTDNIYLKRPSFNQYNAVQSASKPYLPTLQVLEADFCELLLSDPHPNVAKYYGAVPDSSNEWIIGLAFKNYPHHLEAVVENYLQQPQYENFKYDGQKLVDGIEAGVAHIHSLGYAHNDLHSGNIMVDEDLDAIVIDFDAVKKDGTTLEDDDKRGCEEWREESDVATFESDWESVRRLEKYILEGWRP